MLSIRLGLPIVGGQLPAAARALGCPTLVSANALAIYRGAGTEREFTRFRVTLDDLAGLDVALDSAGFVAHAKYRGFPWDVGAYVRLAGAFPWAWWAQMDACCEPEIAASADAVRFRQAETITLLTQCRQVAEQLGVKPPIPVLQGWTPAEYVWHVEQLDLRAEPLVGVGSMCRRGVGGANGLIAVVDALDRALPPACRLHLFGVKSQGMAALSQHPRVASIDSMAWDVEARRIGREGDAGCSMAVRTAAMRHWYERQIRAVADSRGVPGALPLDGVMQPCVSTPVVEWSDLLAAGEIDSHAARAFAMEDSWRATRNGQRRHATAAHGFGVHGVHR